MVVSGSEKNGQSKILNTSTRTCAVMRPLSGTSLKNDMSTFLKPGPRTEFRVALPGVPRFCGANAGRFSRDDDRLADLAGLQPCIGARAIPGADRDFPDDRLEALEFKPHAVAAGRQKVDNIVAGAVAHDDLWNLGPGVGNGHGHAGNDAATGIGHAADDVGGVQLRVSWADRAKDGAREQQRHRSPKHQSLKHLAP
jgi:hypothetical protein